MRTKHVTQRSVCQHPALITWNDRRYALCRDCRMQLELVSVWDDTLHAFVEVFKQPAKTVPHRLNAQ